MNYLPGICLNEIVACFYICFPFFAKIWPVSGAKWPPCILNFSSGCPISTEAVDNRGGGGRLSLVILTTGRVEGLEGLMG